MARKDLPKLAILGDPRKGEVTEVISRFGDFVRGKAEILVSCGVEDCTCQTFDRVDFAVVFGGDGSIIAAARQLSSCNVPVIGVNLGKLGYLAEFSVDELEQFLDQVLSGKAPVERRMMLGCTVLRGEDRQFYSTAVNDVFISAGPPFRMIELKVSLDGEPVAGCVSDGLIISTPTGSTAYNLSAGGPILSGGMEAIVITPICPHSLSFRPIVISADIKVQIQPVRTNPGTTVLVDGQRGCKLAAGDLVKVRRESNDFLIVNNPLRTKWDTLATKLGWAEKPKYQQWPK